MLGVGRRERVAERRVLELADRVADGSGADRTVSGPGPPGGAVPAPVVVVVPRPRALPRASNARLGDVDADRITHPCGELLSP